MSINTLIIDDNDHWRIILTKLVQTNPRLKLVGACASAMEAYGFLMEQEVDLLICDIEMPDLSGLDFVRTMRQSPLVIFVTSHRDYALPCYEVSPVDFLLKPLEPVRFLSSIEKVKQRLLNAAEQAHQEPYFFVRENLQYVQIRHSDVLYIQAQENFLQIVTPTQTFMPILSIAKMEEHLRSDLFLRVHRSYIVPRSAIDRIGKNELILTSGHTVPIGDQYRAQLTRKHIAGSLISRNG